MNCVMSQLNFDICENKVADQLRSYCEADLRLFFRYTDTTIPLLSKSKISNLKPFSETAQAVLCQTRAETTKTGFLASRLNNVFHLPDYLHTCAILCQ